MKSMLLLLILCTTRLWSQEVSVKIVPTLAGITVEPEKTFILQNDTLFIEKLQFYLSNITLRNAASVFTFPETAKLIVAGNLNELVVKTAPGFSPSTLEFTFGTDSSTNCSGIMGGDLDPVLGMYWAWQSGYINFKLEGRSSVLTQKNGNFQFHLGGYHIPFSTDRKVILPVTGNNIVIELPLDDLFAEIRPKGMQTIMRPCKEGSELCTFVAGKFRAK